MHPQRAADYLVVAQLFLVYHLPLVALELLLLKLDRSLDAMEENRGVFAPLFDSTDGAVDGKHIVPPSNSGSFYWNYKGRNRLVLMTIVNVNYKFIMVHFGTNDRVSDGGVIENTVFYEKLKRHTLQIPGPCKSKNSKEPLPIVFVGDEAFAIREDFLKLFGQQQLTRGRRVYKYRLSRRIVENYWLAVFCTTFCEKNDGNEYIPSTYVDTENMDSEEIVMGLRADPNNLISSQRGRNRKSTENTKEVGDLYKECCFLQSVRDPSRLSRFGDESGVNYVEYATTIITADRESSLCIDPKGGENIIPIRVVSR
ncbi:hypothetical protein NQ314_002865 [Rhamnusium bicolor]|uniref:DDE Tnp4 domain-containing protein n=1 Tax=Rhamnusium bicolor TaxID=1586634 RepID=A0AAV8ZQB3_9CUCU|nr:hypothetical protein NQ314_002865 [Rhamnusium bicolor]